MGLLGTLGLRRTSTSAANGRMNGHTNGSAVKGTSSKESKPNPTSPANVADKPSKGPVAQPPPLEDAYAIAFSWLSRLSVALASAPTSEDNKDTKALSSLFAHHAVLRDSMLFTWDVRSPSSPEGIASHILTGLRTKTGGAGGQISNLQLVKDGELAPVVMPFDQPGAVSLSFTFDTALGRGRGAARLFPPSHYSKSSVNGAQGLTMEGEPWIADSAYMMLEALNDHNETHLNSIRANPNLGHAYPWSRKAATRRTEVEESPDVLIVGAGQTGLMLAARFGQIGLRTLVIEKDARVGDEWRRRYRILALHTPKEQHTLLYSPYPKTWPDFTPKDKLGDWFESYAIAHDLVIWTSTALLGDPKPMYEESSGTWTVHVGAPDGSTKRTINVKHVVLATGTLGPPNDPSSALPCRDLFKGRALHASAFKSGSDFKDERVLVVGAANTGADVCEDLAASGARKIWMLQRNSTCVVLPTALTTHFMQTFPPGCDVDVADWRMANVPMRTRERLVLEEREHRIAKGLDPDVEEDDVERMKKFKEKGFLVNHGPDGKGLGFVIFTRFGGHLVDVGFSDLLIGGGVEMVTNTEIQRFKEDGVVCTDGREIECDSVIFATGYQPGTVFWRSLFGDDVIDRAGPVWGLDDECELRGVFRRTGHPGLYYAGGDFGTARWGSRQLGLLLLARKLGYDH